VTGINYVYNDIDDIECARLRSALPRFGLHGDKGLQYFTANIHSQAEDNCHIKQSPFRGINNPIEDKCQQEEYEKVLDLVVHS